MLFEDRLDAACQLAATLWRWREADPLILALGARAVPLGRIVADRLDADLDIVLVRTLRSPLNPAYPIGTVDESGKFALAVDVDFAAMTRGELEREKATQLARIRAERTHLGRLHPGAPIAGRSVIVIDEALESAITMASAVRFVRAQGAAACACAVPVAARAGLARLAPLADACLALAVVERLHTPSDFYRRLQPVEDAEVAELLAA